MFSTAVTIQNTHTNNSSNVIEWHDCDDDDNGESYFLISQCSTVVRTVVRATQQVNGKWPFSGCQNSVTPEPID